MESLCVEEDHVFDETSRSKNWGRFDEAASRFLANVQPKEPRSKFPVPMSQRKPSESFHFLIAKGETIVEAMERNSIPKA
jgi:hypothetical protein